MESTPKTMICQQEIFVNIYRKPSFFKQPLYTCGFIYRHNKFQMFIYNLYLSSQTHSSPISLCLLRHTALEKFFHICGYHISEQNATMYFLYLTIFSFTKKSNLCWARAFFLWLFSFDFGCFVVMASFKMLYRIYLSFCISRIHSLLSP